MPSFEKSSFEEFFRYHDFTQWLPTENIATAIVIVKEKEADEEKSDMVSDVAPLGDKKVVYKIKGGTSGKNIMSLSG